MRNIKYIVIHHSGGSRKKVTTEMIKKWHIEENGWSDIGYHRVIEFDGSVHMGREDSIVGAHAEGFNSKSIGICVTGDFDLEKITENDPQFKTLVQALAVLCRRYSIPVENIIGHRDVYLILGQKIAKTCPGKNLYRLLPRIRELIRAYLG